MNEEFDLDAAVDSVVEELEAPTTPEPAAESVPAAPTPEVEAPAALLAPDTWTKEAQAEWDKLPPRAQQEILKREKDMFAGIEQYKGNATYGENLQRILTPYQEVIQQYGIDPIGQIQQLLAAHYSLSFAPPDQKQQIFLRLAQDYGINLPASTPAGDAPYEDPQVADLRSQIAMLQSHVQTFQQTQQEARRAQLTQEVTAFAADPANVHFNDVYQDMVRLIQTKAATDLKTAYDMAVWSNPQVREKLISSQAEAKAKELAAAEASKLAATKAATAANTRTSEKSRTGASPLGTIDDTIAETLERIRNR